MAKVTVGVPQGTRDFGPDTVRKRNYIFNTIRSVFELYGFEPLETPAMENIETLMGKYGEEGDKLIFRILDSGNPFSVKFVSDFMELLYESINDTDKFSDDQKTNFLTFLVSNSEYLEMFAEDLLREPTFLNKHLNRLKKNSSGKALKYDLTIPFARYVAMNHNKLTFPFKRYQMQPVWRADKPQKGRYREFYQCDADVVGSTSFINEVELIQIITNVFDKLGIKVKIHLNNRKVLAGISKLLGAKDKLVDITVALDKIEKIGVPAAMQELKAKGLEDEIVARLEIMINNLLSKKTGKEMTSELRTILKDTQIGQEGVNEVERVLEFLGSLYTKETVPDITFDISLARGLNYYTGSIIEIKAKDVQMGSIGGGGRYDDLTGLFGVPNIPGVGISFGVDRIYDVMEELKLFPDEVHTGTQVLFFNLGEEESKAAFTLLQQLRSKNIRCELYHEPVKFDKQFKYAEKKNIPYVIIMGSKELAEKTCVIKDIRKGEQQTIPVGKLDEFSFL